MNYDFSGFHSNCTGVHLVSGPCGELYVCCPLCQVVANLEAVSGKIEPVEACKVNKERKVFGKQSKNVDRGNIIE